MRQKNAPLIYDHVSRERADGELIRVPGRRSIILRVSDATRDPLTITVQSNFRALARQYLQIARPNPNYISQLVQ